MTTEPIIQVKNLKKSFGSLQVLKGINTEVEKGEAIIEEEIQEMQEALERRKKYIS